MLSDNQDYRLSRTASDSLVLWLSKTPTVPTNTHAHKTQTCAHMHGCARARTYARAHTSTQLQERVKSNNRLAHDDEAPSCFYFWATASYSLTILLKAVLCKIVDPVMSARVRDGQMWKQHQNQMINISLILDEFWQCLFGCSLRKLFNLNN